MMNFKKYKPYESLKLVDRTWPNNEIKKAPKWCSVDLRDGNQALEVPMNLEQKINFFKFLVKIGFKEIEVGFPAASDTEFLFVRTLIEQNLIPEDVTIQVLTQARKHIIEKTFEALDGVHKAIVHVYNSTSTLQRDVVFNKSKKEIIDLAVEGATLLKTLAQKYGEEHFTFEYSPESFTGTEMDYAVEICNCVLAVFKPTKDKKAILNLPSTVEMASANVYADQIEYVIRNINDRDCVEISLHPHNDRGTAVSSAELGLLAGADRVEGTLFGNGERTGNVDILNVALNMFSQGIDPELDFSVVSEAIEIYESSTGLSVHPRHPYAGTLVYTAFSGSHQDAINKGLAKMKERQSAFWEVPYLPIDPMDVGRSYDPIIRINSQSGKGGVAYILESAFGIRLPKTMQQHFGKRVTEVSDQNNMELLPQNIYELFKQEYVNIESPIALVEYNENEEDDLVNVVATIKLNDEVKTFNTKGAGLLEAFCKGLESLLPIKVEITDYQQHSLEYGSKSRAITYLQIHDENKNVIFGVGISSNISQSSIRALISAVNNSHFFKTSV